MGVQVKKIFEIGRLIMELTKDNIYSVMLNFSKLITKKPTLKEIQEAEKEAQKVNLEIYNRYFNDMKLFGDNKPLKLEELGALIHTE